MRMPPSLHVAVISHRLSVKMNYESGGELVSTVAAILRGPQKDQDTSVHPYVIPTGLGKCRLSLSQFGISMGHSIYEPIPPRLLDPDSIHLWLALDNEGQEMAHERIQQFESRYMSTPKLTSRNDYYSQVFPNPVLNCGFPVPDPLWFSDPPSDSDFQDWFNFLSILFAPWELDIRRAF